MKTEHEFFSQVDVLTKEAATAAAATGPQGKSDRLTKLGDLKAKWRAAKGDAVKQQALSDELDAIAGEFTADHKKAATAPAKPASGPATAAKPGATPSTPVPHGPTGSGGPAHPASAPTPSVPHPSDTSGSHGA